jgi:NADH:ubiquinone oxidoreductase subunit H
MRFLTSLLFFPSQFLLFIILGSFFSFFFVWVRGTFPRLRYDILMDVAWKVFLPITLFLLFILLF